MRLYIPAIGDRVTLTAPWGFSLYLEHRNTEFARTVGLIPPKKDKKDWSDWNMYESGGRGRLKMVQASLPAGTVLECDRIYIRTFNKSRVQLDDDYDSITWRVIGKNGKPATKQRFWVKLPDCYALEYDPASVIQYRDRVKLVKEVMGS